MPPIDSVVSGAESTEDGSMGSLRFICMLHSIFKILKPTLVDAMELQPSY